MAGHFLTQFQNSSGHGFSHAATVVESIHSLRLQPLRGSPKGLRMRATEASPQALKRAFAASVPARLKACPDGELRRL